MIRGSIMFIKDLTEVTKSQLNSIIWLKRLSWLLAIIFGILPLFFSDKVQQKNLNELIVIPLYIAVVSFILIRLIILAYEAYIEYNLDDRSK